MQGDLLAVSASRVVWGQICVVFAIVLLAVWAATQWVAWRLGFQPQLGSPWFALVNGVSPEIISKRTQPNA